MYYIISYFILDCSCNYNSYNGNYSGSEREDSECEELCGSPRLSRRKNRNHNQNLYADTLPEVIVFIILLILFNFISFSKYF